MKKTCPDCAQYKKRIEDLEGRLAYIKFELDDLKSKRFKSNKKKPPDDPPPAPLLKKKRGGLFGHTGWFRKRPKEIDITKEWKELGELMSKVTTIVGHRFSQALGETDPTPPGNA